MFVVGEDVEPWHFPATSDKRRTHTTTATATATAAAAATAAMDTDTDTDTDTATATATATGCGCGCASRAILAHICWKSPFQGAFFATHSPDLATKKSIYHPIPRAPTFKCQQLSVAL